MCVCVCMYVCMYECVYACGIYAYIHTYFYICHIEYSFIRANALILKLIICMIE